MEKKLKPSTLCVRGGWKPKNGEPVQPPIVQCTTFKYDNTEEMAMLFDLKKEGYFYTRLQNPTSDSVAAKIAALEGGVGGMLTSSGQAANFYAIFNICQAGDHFVTSNEIYGGTYNLFGVTMKKLGIECTFVNQDASEEEIQKAFRPNTKALFGETISNPGCRVLDIEKFARIAHRNGVPLIIDNTFATPINCRPFEWGCDIVTHSTTKYMDGHATQVGGCVVDSGNFDWDAHADKFPGLTTPDESYHGLTYTKAFGKGAYMTKLVAQLMRDLGSTPSPHNAFMLNIGLETLHLRMQRHCENAQKVAEFLHADPHVAWIRYCGLKDDADYELGQKYLPNGSCGVLAFGLKGDRDTAIKFMDSLRLVNIATHVADARSCVLHPASHTHRQLSDEQLREAALHSELAELDGVLHRQYEQYKRSKEGINLINRRYHELKVQLARIREEQDQTKQNAAIAAMEQNIRQYEAENKTGNPVLDTLLTAKTMECQQENITITSVADGRMLGFLTIRELCTIVGVALDNAIAAVRAEPDPEKRLIKVAVYSQGGFAMLRFEHYTEAAPALDADGLPQQGSDLKSVRTTVGQHGGSMTMHWENNWCTLRILFPLPQKQ